MTYWTTATTDQRLAQIDGGIEAGMTSKQIAMCLGAPIYDNGRDNAVSLFAARHGRKFTTPRATASSRGGKISGRISRAIQFRKAGYTDVTHKDAFSIFEAPPEENPFASLSYEELDA